jgi:hypothetical protein
MIGRLKAIALAALRAALSGEAKFEPHQAIAILQCSKCQSIILNPTEDKCSMCGESLVQGANAKTPDPMLVQAGTAIWTDGTVRARTPSGKLIINREVKKCTP